MFLLSIWLKSKIPRRINDIVGILAWRDADTLDDIKKIYRAKYRNELDDDLEEHVEKKFKPVVMNHHYYYESKSWKETQSSLKTWSPGDHKMPPSFVVNFKWTNIIGCVIVI